MNGDKTPCLYVETRACVACIVAAGQHGGMHADMSGCMSDRPDWLGGLHALHRGRFQMRGVLNLQRCNGCHKPEFIKS